MGPTTFETLGSDVVSPAGMVVQALGNGLLTVSAQLWWSSC